MKVAKLISAIVTLCVSLPIWFYLLYQVLARVEASELMWFLFWVYVPATIFISLLMKIAETD